eukprot:CAMPEP_0183709774 /NCGR_PEP_ID=MMETSP0737-20130205/5753_1 /TAXON_ID=385413 /ORGANISM="Thalassiosira miniscula, Strain CCMP1093" /LENGTH=157 /DNA_ID=CAMNT_0025937965 /DNA_START=78 /DNA_END=547 /DNA_ORIENTATION=-
MARSTNTACAIVCVAAALTASSSSTNAFLPPIAPSLNPGSGVSPRTASMPSTLRSLAATTSRGANNGRTRDRRKTQLAANGGMDDYDAQMAAMLSAATTDEATSEQPSSVVDEIAAEMLDSSRTSSNNSNNKWSGQNIYTQQLLSESQPPLQFHDYS